jgi:aspartyl-tRNA(Asn)/glutamyl-tRNA(Gln) amidotransferase subunit A
LNDLYCRSRAEGFGEEVKRRILVGTYALSTGYYDAYYLSAQKARRLIADDFANAFANVDLIMAPTTPTPAFKLGEKQADPIAMYMADVNTVGVNLAGLPGLSAPAGLVDGLPVGLQIIANHFEEPRLLAAAHALQQLTDWHLARPPEAS